MQQPKVALVHDYLVQNGGAEKTLEAISELFPDAPIYTSIYNPKNFDDKLNQKKIVTLKFANKVLNTIPILAKYFTFLIPLIFEEFDFSEYDLVISDSSAYAKGILTKPETLHISYIHTPPRFLYGYSVENKSRNSWFYKPVVMLVDHYLKMWDYAAAQRPDLLVTNSEETRRRIQRFYKRDATVIYPPVDVKYKVANNIPQEEYFLITGRLVAYKNFDKVIEAFNKLPQLKLYVIGKGPEEQTLKKLAKDNTVFLGRVSDAEKHAYMAGCLGLINAVQDEDFGIVPIETMAHGKPVLGHKSAGHLETIIEGVTGEYFTQFDATTLSANIKDFYDKIKRQTYRSEEIRKSTEKFSKETFKARFKAFVLESWDRHSTQNI